MCGVTLACPKVLDKAQCCAADTTPAYDGGGHGGGPGAQNRKLLVEYTVACRFDPHRHHIHIHIRILSHHACDSSLQVLLD